MTAPPSSAPTGRIAARIASVHVDMTCNAFLNDCFQPFGIHVVPITGDPAMAMQRQKFEACVVRLYDPEAERILGAARTSSSNRPLVIYGIARNGMEAIRYAGYGINAVLDEPLDRLDVVKVVRGTYRLVINELRRYVRVPIRSQALVETSEGSTMATTVDVSAGGLSVRSAVVFPREQVRLMLALPGLPPLNLLAQVCWQRLGAEKLYGMRFDPYDASRFVIRNWIDQHLEIVV